MRKTGYILIAFILLVLAGGLFFNAFSPEGDLDTNTGVNSAIEQGDVIVIETEVDGPADCTSLEKYDAERKVCYAECQTEAECDELEARIDAEVEKMDFSSGQKKQKNFEKLVADDEATQSLIDNALVVYSIDKGEKYTLLSGKETKEAQDIKTLIKKILPTDLSDKHVDKLVLMYHKDKDGLAFVAPARGGDTRIWSVFVNMNSGSGKKELIETLVHEFGHILFLNNEALSQSEMCDGYVVDEGCADGSTILGKFYNKFWEGKFDPEAGLEENFMKEQTAFVDDYAATNPTEDLAETFAYFVLKPKPQNPQYTSDNKILFFYQFPELVSLRKQIRKALRGEFSR